MEQQRFRTPDDAFRGTDFWMLNGDLTEENIVEQLHEMKDKGVHSFIARTYLGLKSDYPGPRFKEKMKVIIETSKKLGLKVFLQAGYMPEAVLGLPADHALRYIYPVKEGEEKGRRVFCRHEGISFVEHNSGTFLDMFDEVAMEHYLKVSYEEMWHEFADEYGKTVTSVWVDEPSYDAAYLPWTPKLETLFREAFGYDLIDKIWMLYYDAEGCQTVRYHYRVLMRDLLEQNYFRKVRDWCHDHDLMFSGHLMMEDTLQTQISRAQACMPYYRYFDIPGIDVLRGDYNWVDDPLHTLTPLNKRFVRYNTPMQCVSAAKQAGKKYVLAEMYGVAGENFNFRNMTHMFDTYAAAGINYRSVHGIFYTLKGRGKRAYPPHISYYQPFWPKYKNVTDYCARVSAFISDGRSDADIAVIHPLETAYMLYRGPMMGQGAGSNELRRLDNRLYDLLVALRSEHRDADFADLASLRDMGEVRDGRLFVGEMAYRTVILPHLQVVTEKLLSLLEELVAQGGRVIVYGDMPTMLDGTPDAAVAERLEKIAVKAETLSRVLDELPEPAYHLEGVGVENLSVNHRACEDGEKFFICNFDCAHAVSLTLNTAGRGKVYRYDAYSGQAVEYPAQACGNGVAVEITVPEGGSVLLSVEGSCEDVTAPTAVRAERVLSLDGTWKVEPQNDNVLLLEFCRYRKGEGGFSSRLPIIAVQTLLSKEEYRGEVTLQFEFDSADDLDGISLALEEPEAQRITLDGRVLTAQADGYFMEKAFETVPVGSLPAGHHVLEITREFFPLSKVTNALTQLFETRHGVELEPMYLRGPFAVTGHRCISENGCVIFERDFLLEKLPTKLQTQGELTADGFPFFVGEVVLAKEITVPEGLDIADAKFRLPVMNAGCGELYVGGVYAGDINRAPCDLAVGSLLKPGVNTVQIKLYTTLYNIIGPFHRPQGNVGNTFGGGYRNPDAAWLSINADAPDWQLRMNDFYPDWTDQYNVVPLGIRDASLVF